MTKIIVIADTQDQLNIFRNKNKQFILGLAINNRHRLEGLNVCYYLTTVNTFESWTVGVQADAIINLSSFDTERIKDAIMPCLW